MKRTPMAFCWLNRHEPTRDRARWDGMNFVSKCKNCGRDIRRKESGVWMREWLDPKEISHGTVI